METNFNYEETDFRSTINLIPTEISTISDSKIPFLINVVPGNIFTENTQFIETPLERCIKCKTYVNPFVEIITPGTMYKCNICYTLNTLETPFQQIVPFENRASNEFDPISNSHINSKYFSNPELRYRAVEFIAPYNYSIKVAVNPTYVFLIEATEAAKSSGVFRPVVNCINSNVELIRDSLNRIDVVIAFYNERLFLLKPSSKTEFTIIQDMSEIESKNEIPQIFKNNFAFKKNEVDLKVDDIENYFREDICRKNNLGFALSAVEKLVGNSGTICTFVCSVPNCGVGKIVKVADPNIKCQNSFYKQKASELSKASICVNLFAFSAKCIELITLSILSKFTCGVVNFYPNFDSADFPSNSKFITDFISLIEKDIGYESVSKVRISDSAQIKEYFGSLNIVNDSILKFANFNPSNGFTFEIKLDKSINLSIQIALLRVLENGDKSIRVINHIIPKVSNAATSAEEFYNTINVNMLSHSVFFKSIYFEALDKSGIKVIISEIKQICKGYKRNMRIAHKGLILPTSLNLLPTKFLSLMKSIPFKDRTQSNLDYKAYYIYMFYTQYSNFVDVLIYSKLYALHYLIDQADDVTPEIEISLTLNNLEINGLYLLDTGCNLFFFISREIDPSVSNLLINPQINGSFIFERYDNAFSERVFALVNKIRASRFIVPTCFCIRDNANNEAYINMFFPYFVEDAVFGLPSLSEFVSMLNEKVDGY